MEYGQEQAMLADITNSADRVGTLLEKLARESVTPVTFRDVVEDWLLT